MGWLNRHPDTKRLRALAVQAQQVRALQSRWRSASPGELQARAESLSETSQGTRKRNAEEVVPLNRYQACQRLALAAQAVTLVHGIELHHTQLMAAIASASGHAIEMQTGEGKTLVAGVTAIVRALDRRGVHVASTNDYLAERDLAELSDVFSLLGLKGGLLPAEHDVAARRAAYGADVTYGPGYQFGFDYLFDQLTIRQREPFRLGQNVLQTINGFDFSSIVGQFRQHYCAIIDEADSVLVDEATTPLVISAGEVVESNPDAYRVADQVVRGLQLNEDFTLDRRHQVIRLNEATRERLMNEFGARRRKIELVRPWHEYLENALRAYHFFQKSEHYVVRDGEVQIVDQYTGRIHPDRHWQGGLHQAVEAKEGLDIKLRPSSLARVTRQRYFRRYAMLTGLSGTLSGIVAEMKNVYRMSVIPIPTHRPSQRKVARARFFKNWDAKIDAIVQDCATRNARGQPLLIGTRTIRESIRIEEAMRAAKLDVVVLNGVQDRAEAEIIAQAGQFGAITIATNMAGRGTDIKPCQRALAAGGLHVIGTEPNPSARVDRQLIGRAARQGDPGSAQFFISGEDQLIDENAPELARKIASAAGSAGETSLDFTRDVIRLQMHLESQKYRTRQLLMDNDRWMDLTRVAIASSE